MTEQGIRVLCQGEEQRPGTCTPWPYTAMRGQFKRAWKATQFHSDKHSAQVSRTGKTSEKGSMAEARVGQVVWH